MRIILLLTFLGLLLNFGSQAQSPKIKFGKVSKEELLMKEYAKDTSANAVILYDSGNLYFEYNNYENPKRFQYNYTRHLRIKIFNKDAIDLGNHNIYLYHKKGNDEVLETFKAYTFNLEEGKIIKNKFGKKDLLIEEYDKNRNIAKCIMPNVKEGSIIDITYIIQSDYIHYLREWKFQYNIPVVWSEFRAVVPEFYKYKHYFKGYYDLAINDFKSQEEESFSILYEDVVLKNGITETVRGHWDLSSLSNIFHFASKDIPAFKNEPFSPSNENYIFKLQFELSQTKFPKSPPKSYAKSWKSVNKKIMNDDNCGKLLNSSKLTKNILSEVVDESDSISTKMLKIYNHVKDKYKWNGKYRYYTTQSNFRKVIEEKSGSSADLNLLLVTLFREADLNAFPVLLSTRNNGMIVPLYPGENAFNYIVAYLLIEKESYLFDATDKFCMPNFLPTRCLNGKARITGENFTDWINLKAKNISNKTVYGNFVIDSDNETFNGNLKILRDNYFAYSIRKSIDKYDDLDKYMDNYKDKNHSMEIENYTFKGVDTLSLPVEMFLELSIIDGLNQAGNLIYFNPLNIFTGEDNPFKSETRSYPVNFAYPTEEVYVMNYQLPEGYEVNELPENAQLELPDNSANFSYTIVQNGNTIQVTLKKNITKTIFDTNEYLQLRELFNQMISKQSEQIVLKRVG